MSSIENPKLVEVADTDILRSVPSILSLVHQAIRRPLLLRRRGPRAHQPEVHPRSRLPEEAPGQSRWRQ